MDKLSQEQLMIRRKNPLATSVSVKIGRMPALPFPNPIDVISQPNTNDCPSTNSIRWEKRGREVHRSPLSEQLI